MAFFTRYGIILLQTFIGGVFIFSGIAKLYPVEFFELLLIDAGTANWTLAPFLSRLIISMELLTGFFLILHLKPKSTLIAALSLLSVFSLFLIYLWISKGSNADCGCLGSFLEISPGAALIKNTLLICIIGIILICRKEYGALSNSKLLFALLIGACIATPIILNPIRLSAGSHETPPQIDLSLLPSPLINDTPRNLQEGKIILSFFLVNCPHCKIIARTLDIAHKKNQLPETIFVFSGNKEKISAFLEDINSSFPYIIYNDERVFAMTKGVFPSIVFLNNGKVKKYWTGETFTYAEVAELSQL